MLLYNVMRKQLQPLCLSEGVFAGRAFRTLLRACTGLTASDNPAHAERLLSGRPGWDTVWAGILGCRGLVSGRRMI